MNVKLSIIAMRTRIASTQERNFIVFVNKVLMEMAFIVKVCMYLDNLIQ